MNTPEFMTVQAGDDRTVRLLDKRVVKPGEKAEHVPWSLYLQRRLDCGDLVKVAASVPPVTSGAPASATPATAAVPATPASPAPAAVTPPVPAANLISPAKGAAL